MIILTSRLLLRCPRCVAVPFLFVFCYDHLKVCRINIRSITTTITRLGKAFCKHTTILHDLCFVQALSLRAYHSFLHPKLYISICAVGVPLSPLPFSKNKSWSSHARPAPHDSPAVPLGMGSSIAPGGPPKLGRGSKRSPSNHRYHATYL